MWKAREERDLLMSKGEGVQIASKESNYLGGFTRKHLKEEEEVWTTRYVPRAGYKAGVWCD
jgi:hypothetical protein